MRIPASLVARWPAVAALASAAMLAAAHGFEAFGYAPCNLCLRQREVYWGALALAALGLALKAVKRPLGPALSLALGAVFLTGMVVASYHAGVEWKWWPGPTTCSGGGSGGQITTDALSQILAGAKVHPPACDEAAWRMLGVSMAGYNAVISAALAALSFGAAYGRKPA